MRPDRDVTTLGNKIATVAETALGWLWGLVHALFGDEP